MEKTQAPDFSGTSTKQMYNIYYYIKDLIFDGLPKNSNYSNHLDKYHQELRREIEKRESKKSFSKGLFAVKV
jgi:hypothetical protein